MRHFADLDYGRHVFIINAHWDQVLLFIFNTTPWLNTTTARYIQADYK